jgi:hypothetical protein
MFFVLFSGAKTNNEDGLLTREQATYSWPCENHENSKLIPQTSNDWPCDLLIVVAKANRTENWIRLNWNGRSVGMIGIHGIRTSSPLNFPLMIVACITLFISFLTDNRVPLQNLGWFRFRNIIMIDSTFSCKLYGRVPGTVKRVQKFHRIVGRFIFVGHAVNGFIRTQSLVILLWIIQFKLSTSLFLYIVF